MKFSTVGSDALTMMKVDNLTFLSFVFLQPLCVNVIKMVSINVRLCTVSLISRGSLLEQVLEENREETATQRPNRSPVKRPINV